jgi:hypothetical protein
VILLKINSKGRLEGNWEEIAELAEEYDKGVRTEDAYQSKLISLIFDRGYEQAMSEIEQVHERTVLLMSCTGGNA